MKKILTLITVCFLVSFTSYTQKYQEVLKEIFLDAEFFLMDESYADALVEYQKLLPRGYENNANINYRIGVCYLNMPGEKQKSIPYLQKAVTNVTAKYQEGIFKETRAPYDAWLYLGNAYRITNQLENAVQCYQKYKELLNNEKSEGSKYADQQIVACNNAKKSEENPVYVIQDNLGEVINTEFSDFNPVLSADENVMVYMTALKFYNALKFAKKVDGKWTESINITPEIQSDGNQFATSLSKDGTQLFLNIEDNFNSDIMFSSYQNGRWAKSELLNKNINTKFWESHASISPAGDALYFTSNRKGGFGDMDIYVSQKNQLGEWGEALNLGPAINTDLNEDHPFLSEDGKVLYFASQGHFNIGGYDIFKSEQMTDGTWAKPINLGYPLNTTDDDLFFFPSGNGKYGYQARFADDNFGSRDIYRFEIFENEGEYLAAVQQRSDELTKQMVEEVTEEQKVEEEQVKEVVEETTKEVTEEVKEEVKPEVEVKTVFLRTIFFDFDKYSLTSQSKTTLDNLTDIMRLFPEMHIIAIGHTDAIGTESYNLDLSKKRADSAIGYLKTKGIESGRLQIKALGESEHIAINQNPDGSDNPEGRKFNRRVEFKVIKPELPNVKIEPVAVPEKLKIK
jgi:outer membrane protein OmpA-like peptidoglycan-associated protein/Tol biopolymer transport system component